MAVVLGISTSGGAAEQSAQRSPRSFASFVAKDWGVLDSCEHPADAGRRLFLCRARIPDAELNVVRAFGRKHGIEVAFPNTSLALLSAPADGGSGVESLWTRFEFLANIPGALNVLHGSVVLDATRRRALVAVVRSAQFQNPRLEAALYAVDLAGRGAEPVSRYDPREWESWYKNPAPLTRTDAEHRQFIGGVAASRLFCDGPEVIVALRPRQEVGKPSALACLRYDQKADKWSPLRLAVWERELDGDGK